jgi:hypothetical protein
MEKVFIGRAVGQVMPALMNVAERRAGSAGDNLSAVAVTLLDDAAELAGKPDTLDTLVTPPRHAGRQILDPNLELMHQEILASRLGRIGQSRLKLPPRIFIRQVMSQEITCFCFILDTEDATFPTK